MEDIMKVVKSLGESGLLIKEIGETIRNETKEQKGAFLPNLSGIVVATMLENALTANGNIGAGKGVMRAG